MNKSLANSNYKTLVGQQVSPTNATGGDLQSLDSMDYSKDGSENGKKKVLQPVYASLFEVPSEGPPNKSVKRKRNKHLLTAIGKQIPSTQRVELNNTISHTRNLSENPIGHKEHPSLPSFPNIHRTFVEEVPNRHGLSNPLSQASLKSKKMKKNSSGAALKPKAKKMSDQHKTDDSESKHKYVSSDPSVKLYQVHQSETSPREFPHNDKYLLILENNRALRRQIREMENMLDFKEMDFEQKFQELQRGKVLKDKEMVHRKFDVYKDLVKSYNK